MLDSLSKQERFQKWLIPLLIKMMGYNEIKNNEISNKYFLLGG